MYNISALQLWREDVRISALLHIISVGTRYTEHNMCTAIGRNVEQKRHCAYNVTLWCVLVTSVFVEKQ